MGSRSRELKIIIGGDATSGVNALKSLDRQADATGGGLSKFGKIAVAGLAVAAGGAIALGKSFLDAAVESEKVTKQTAAVIKSMGNVANVSAADVEKLSSKLSLMSGVDDEVIQAGENVLLTFGNVRNEIGAGNNIFDRATASALDMSVALGTDLSSANIMLGKALNDPVKGMTALSKSGVSFSAEQKEMVKNLVASGDTLGAQKIILGELDKQFSGSAAAQATAGDKLKVAWGNVQEQLGGYLLPVFEKVASFLSDNLPGAIAKTVSVAKGLGDWVQEHKPLVIGFGIAIGTVLVAAFLAWAGSAAAAAASTLLALAPVIAVTAAIGLLTAGVIWAYTNLGWFRAAIDGVAKFATGVLWPALKTIAGFFTGTLIPVIGKVIAVWWNFHKGVFDVVTGIIGKAGEIVSFVAGLPGKISSAASGMFDGFKNSFKGALNWIIGKWNALEFKVPGVGVGPFKTPGFTLGVPDIPLMHTGGIVPGGKGNEPIYRLQGGEGVFTPSQMDALAPAGEGGTVVHIHLEGAVIANEREFDRMVAQAVNRNFGKGVR